MRTFSLLKDMPVYDQRRNLVGYVSDICMNENGTVSHYLVQEKGLLGKKYKIPIKELNCEQDQLIMRDRKHLSLYKESDNVYTMTHGNPLAKKKSYSQNGEMLGLLDDVYFMEELGTIVGYELTDGFFSDIKKGKRVVRTTHPLKIDNEAIVMSAIKLRGGHTHDEMSKLSKQGPG